MSESLKTESEVHAATLLVREMRRLEQERDEAHRLLRVALGLLRVANFETHFEGRRCFDLERQIEALLPHPIAVEQS